MSTLARVDLGVALVTFAAGLLSFFSPCVAPLVPGYIGYLSGVTVRAPTGGVESSGGAVAIRTRSTASTCLLFVAGFSAAFVALGLASASLGRVLAAYQLVLETVVGIVMIVMGAFLLDLLPRGITAVLLREGRLHLAGTSQLGLLGPFVLGVIFAAGWTPCIGPVLGPLLLYVSATADRGTGAFLLSLYAFGFALPFLAVGLGWSKGLRALGWARAHGALITRISGVALIVVGIVYLTGEVSVFASWAQQFAVLGPR